MTCTKYATWSKSVRANILLHYQDAYMRYEKIKEVEYASNQLKIP